MRAYNTTPDPSIASNTCVSQYRRQRTVTDGHTSQLTVPRGQVSSTQSDSSSAAVTMHMNGCQNRSRPYHANFTLILQHAWPLRNVVPRQGPPGPSHMALNPSLPPSRNGGIAWCTDVVHRSTHRAAPNTEHYRHQAHCRHTSTTAISPHRAPRTYHTTHPPSSSSSCRHHTPTSPCTSACSGR